MLVLLRIIATGGFFWLLLQARHANNPLAPAGDLTMAAYMAACVALALVVAAMWAPYFGEKLSQPFTGMLTEGESLERKNRWLQLIRWLDKKRRRRAALFFCFLEGVRRPDSPVAFYIGMKNAKSGSWFEKIYAREVYRFGNAQNCLEAYRILKERGIPPGPHENGQINLLVMNMEKRATPAPPPMPLPKAPPPPKLERDPRITLFETNAPEGAAESRPPDSLGNPGEAQT